MLSNHYPLAFATPYNWLIAALVFLMGVTIRHYFNTMHARQGQPNWTWAATAVIFVLIMALSSVPARYGEEAYEDAAVPENFERIVTAEGYGEVKDIVIGRCSMCHAPEPSYEGFHWPPKAVRLDTDTEIAKNARMIYVHAGLSTAMPPGNVTWMEPEERAKIVAWYKAL